MAEKFVSYLRVSTDRQGRSGLGLERLAIMGVKVVAGHEPSLERLTPSLQPRAPTPKEKGRRSIRGRPLQGTATSTAPHSNAKASAINQGWRSP